MNQRTARLLWRGATATRTHKRVYYAMWKRTLRKERPELRAQLKALVKAYESASAKAEFRMARSRAGVWSAVTGSAR